MNWDPFIKASRVIKIQVKKQQQKQSKYVKTKSIKTEVVQDKNNCRIIAMLLKRHILRIQKQYFMHFKQNIKKKINVYNRMSQIINQNLNACKILGWWKLKENVQLKKNSHRYTKSLINLAHRLYLQKMGKSLENIKVYASEKQIKQVKKNQNYSPIILNNIFKRLIVKRNHQAFKKLQRYKRFLKKVNKKLKIFDIISNRYVKQSKTRAFIKIIRFAYQETLSSERSPRFKYQKIKNQIDDMVIQLQNKNQSIQRLTEQLRTIRKLIQQQNQNRHNYSLTSNKSFDKLSYKSNHSKDSKYSRQLSRKSSIQDKSQKQYSVISQDYSIGSILGSSFVSLASNRQQSIFDQPGGDCNCQYRYKYIEHKSLYQTHKNQLDILKKQLQVAKDLNQHFENELKFYNEKQDHQEIQKIKSQVKQAQKDRDALRQKSFKCQKYIATLKMQLRQKMQDLYRKVKKQQ